jgi:Ras GTPase-activating-like protein IQGAP2/3
MSTYYRDEQPNSPGTMSGRRLTNRNTNRYSVSHLFSVAAEQDMEVQDELARGMFPMKYLLVGCVFCGEI